MTAGFVDCASPVFDPGGDYLYYLSDRSFDPSYSAFDRTWIYANATNLVAVPLRKDVASPLAPRNDVESADDADDEKKEDGEKSAKGDDDKSTAEPEKEPVLIDLEGFEARAVVLPPDAGNYSNLGAVKGKVLYSRDPRTGSDGESSPFLYWDLEDREEKTILDNVDGYALSANGKKILVVAGGSFAIVDVAAGQKMDKKLATSSMEMMLDAARRVAPDLQRCLASRTRLLLRPQHARRRLGGHARALRRAARRCRQPVGPQLHYRRADRGAQHLALLPRRRRRREGGQPGCWSAGRRLGVS